MAGSAKPDGVDAEGRVTFEVWQDTFNTANYDPNIYLLNGNINSDHSQYGSYLLSITHNTIFEFTLYQASNIWATCNRVYADAGGGTSKPVRLYRFDSTTGTFSTTYELLPTNTLGSWYLLAENLSPGRYKMIAHANYANFNEWYIESKSAFLFLVNDKIYKFNSGVWEDTGLAEPISEQDFKVHGMGGFTGIDSEKLSLLGSTKPKVLMWTPFNKDFKLQITNLPPDCFILSVEDIKLAGVSNIDSFFLNSTGEVKVAVSVDKGDMWQTWNNTSNTWNFVQCTKEAVKNNGMTAETFNARSAEDWNTLRNNGNYIRFAFYFSIPTTSDTAKITLLSGQFDMSGRWGMAIPGTDYSYEYPTNQIMRINILKNGSYKINYVI